MQGGDVFMMLLLIKLLACLSQLTRVYFCHVHAILYVVSASAAPEGFCKGARQVWVSVVPPAGPSGWQDLNVRLFASTVLFSRVHIINRVNHKDQDILRYI